MTLLDFNRLDHAAAVRLLLQCGGSTRWAQAMAAARPFRTVTEVSEAVDRIWRDLEPSDWLEAFATHSRIGAGAAAGADRWSAHEQAGMASASDAVRARMSAANRAYEARFGYMFIICATGRSGDQMLAECERRLANDPAAELAVAAEEQRRITRLRIAKVFA